MTRGPTVVRVAAIAVAVLLSWFAVAILTMLVLAMFGLEIGLIDAMGEAQSRVYGIHVGHSVVEQSDPTFYGLLAGILAPATAFAIVFGMLLWRRWNAVRHP